MCWKAFSEKRLRTAPETGVEKAAENPGENILKKSFYFP
jgi:hypothetical protein